MTIQEAIKKLEDQEVRLQAAIEAESSSNMTFLMYGSLHKLQKNIYVLEDAQSIIDKLEG